MRKRLSIFGGTGFVGTEFCQKYERDCIVIPRDQDVAESEDILYLISTTDNYNIFTDPLRDIETNLVKLVRVLEANKGRIKTINFVSSWFVYGKQAQDGMVSEDAPCSPKGFYSITKHAAEGLVESWAVTFNVNYRILRLGNIIGPGDKGVSTKKNALTYLIHQLAQDKPIKLYNNGEFFRDYIDVADVASAIHLILESGKLNEVFNISYGKATKFRDLIDVASTYLDSKSTIEVMEPTDFHLYVQTKSCILEAKKLYDLGFAPKHNPIASVKRIIDDLRLKGTGGYTSTELPSSIGL